jgi:hypothetical protein
MEKPKNCETMFEIKEKTSITKPKSSLGAVQKSSLIQWVRQTNRNAKNAQREGLGDSALTKLPVKGLFH